MATTDEAVTADTDDPSGERALVERAAAGDETAFTTLYTRQRPQIARYLRCRIACADDAQDVEQEVFMLAHRGLRHFQWQGIPVSAWLLAIARHRVAQYWRVRGRRPQVALRDGWVAPAEGPEECVERAERRQTALAAVAGLPVAQRDAVLLRMRGLSHREVAATMGRSEVNVRVLQHRAIARLREAFQLREEC
jgi:RNA polymerase sigma-70 factor (ECF subfamily)